MRTDSFGPNGASLDAALSFHSRGWSVVYVPLCGKAPRERNWQSQKPTLEQVRRQFAKPGNIGIRLGRPSGNLVDVDLDSRVALALAPSFLPPTSAVFGRASKPKSHWVYIVEPLPKPMGFKDGSGHMLVELRSNGQQTIFPGSIHPSGEAIRWDSQGNPDRCSPVDLLASIARLAAATLLVESYPAQGSRHEAMLAFSGLLLRGGQTIEQVEQFVRAVAQVAGDTEVRDRVATVRTTAAKLENAQATTGARELSKLLGKPIVEKLRSWLWIRPNASGDAPEYVQTPDGIIWRKPSRDGVLPIRLTNFAARIAGDVCHVNGSEEHRALDIEATLDGRRHRFAIPAATFPKMRWPSEQMGPKAVVFPGIGLADHARAAIQLLSRDIATRMVFEHSGWAELSGGWVYLHAGGGIGGGGLLPGIEVILPTSLNSIVLPSPPQGEELQKAVRASLRLLEIAPLRISIPIVGAVYRAVLGDTDFGIHLSGKTGVFKTSFAALAQSHFGAGFNDRNLPGNWSSTANSLEAIAFAAKDALVVFDDFCPNISSKDRLQQQHVAERVFRAQGNRAGRLRMNPDTSLRAAKPPRGLILSTGEDTPSGGSLRARMLVLEVSPTDITPERLSEAQREGRAGRFAQAISGYLRWLAPQLTLIRMQLNSYVVEARHRAFQSGQHRRTASIVADLCAGWHFFLQFCEDTQVCEASTLREQVYQAIGEAAEAQNYLHVQSDPAARYIALLSSALASGQAHLADGDGQEPPDAQKWGWRKNDHDCIPAGYRVGWISGDGLYLDPDASFKVAQEIGRGGDELTISPHTLRRRLHERGMLASVEDRRGKLTVRRTLEGRRREVLHIHAELLGVADEGMAQSAQVVAGKTTPDREKFE